MVYGIWFTTVLLAPVLFAHLFGNVKDVYGCDTSVTQTSSWSLLRLDWPSWSCVHAPEAVAVVKTEMENFKHTSKWPKDFPRGMYSWKSCDSLGESEPSLRTVNCSCCHVWAASTFCAVRTGCLSIQHQKSSCWERCEGDIIWPHRWAIFNCLLISISGFQGGKNIDTTPWPWLSSVI